MQIRLLTINYENIGLHSDKNVTRPLHMHKSAEYSSAPWQLIQLGVGAYFGLFHGGFPKKIWTKGDRDLIRMSLYTLPSFAPPRQLQQAKTSPYVVRENSFFQLSQPRAELAMVCPPNHSTDRHLAIPTCEFCSHTQARSIESWPVHLFTQPSLCLAQLSWDPHSRAPGWTGLEEMTLNTRTDTPPAQMKMPGAFQTAQIIFLSCNRHLVKTSCFQKADPSMGAWEMQDVCLALKIQPKELQRCTWGLDAMAVPIHTQSKSRDKYESEKEKLWNFVQVLSTFTHAEKLYLSKPPHWLHMWARIAHVKRGHWI